MSSSSSAPKPSPKAWEIWELQAAGAIDRDRVVTVSDLSDLQQDQVIWHFFEREKWKVTDSEYNALLPSMRLAARLLQVGMPYMTTFLPASKIHEDFEAKQKALGYEGAELLSEHYTIPQATEISYDAAVAARKELEEIVKVVEWKVNFEMFQQHGWLGITRQIIDDSLPWENLERDDIKSSDGGLIYRGETRRHLVIGIMGEYVSALRNNRESDEKHMRAAFLAGVTIAHEIAHVIWHQDFRSIDYADDGSEPWVGDDLESELGNAFINFIFSGHTPRPCNLSQEGGTNFKLAAALHWYPKLSTSERKFYSTLSSISMQYMETVFSEAFWSALGDPLDKLNTEFYVEARKQLNPRNHTDPVPATAITPEFELMAGDRPAWKHSALKKVRSPIQPGEISQEEVDCILNSGGMGEGGNGETERDKYAAVLENMDRVEKMSYLNSLWAFTLVRQAEAGEEDEEDFGETPLVDSVDDGFLPEDLPPGQAGGTETFFENPILITYKPKITLSHNTGRSKRRQTDEEDDEDEGNVVRSKRARKVADENPAEALLRRADQEDRFNDEDYDCRDIDEVLDNISSNSIGKLTRLEAYNYCVKHQIRVDPLDDNQQLQGMKLDNGLDPKHALIERIRRYALTQAEKRFQDDKHALLKIKKALAYGYRAWDRVDLVAFIKKAYPGLKKIALPQDWDKVEEYFDKEVQVAMVESEKELGSKAAEDRSTQEPADLELNNWDDESFEAFFRQNNLPLWGNQHVWKIRVQRFRKWGRNEIPQKIREGLINVNWKGKFADRRNRLGKEEAYSFHVGDFERTSAASLKWKLFEIGHFSANSDLDIYMGGDRRFPWGDEKPIAYYAGFNFKQLELVVREFKGHKASSGSSKESAKAPGEDNPVVYQPARLSKGTESIAQIAVAEGSQASSSKSQPTAADLLQESISHSQRLDKAMQPSGSKASATEILNNLEDVDDVRAGPSTADDRDEEKTVEEKTDKKGKGKSHMADMYERTVEEKTDKKGKGKSHMADMYERTVEEKTDKKGKGKSHMADMYERTEES